MPGKMIAEVADLVVADRMPVADPKAADKI